MDADPDWVHGHPHDPNPAPPAGGESITLVQRGGASQQVTLDALHALPGISVPACYIVSTGHGVSGPFTFGGVALAELLTSYLPDESTWRTVDVVSGDGFGVRLTRAELFDAPPDRPILLAHTVDGAPLTRASGLVRLIVPTEVDDALKQVKWVAQIVLM
jgi:hypothetical protein